MTYQLTDQMGCPWRLTDDHDLQDAVEDACAISRAHGSTVEVRTMSGQPVFRVTDRGTSVTQILLASSV